MVENEISHHLTHNRRNGENQKPPCFGRPFPAGIVAKIDTVRFQGHHARMIQTLIHVALGGAIGASARYLTGVAVMRLLGPGFPWATLMINVLGSFVMGLVVVWLAQLSATRYAPLVMTGVLGGFTTFSAFSLDAITLWERGETSLAAGYVAASVVLSLGALLAGLFLARGVL